MYDYHIAIIDDNKAVLQSLKLVLEGVFRSVTVMTLPNALPAILAAGKVDAVLLDMNFGSGKLNGSDGLFWLKRIKKDSTLSNPPSVVLITAFGEIELAVQALKEGADDFVQKPWDNRRLVEIMSDAIAKRRQAMNPASNTNEERYIAGPLIHSLVQRNATTYAKP
ncbi:MAG: response regulator, partial [Prevotella sp.]|nr:response regulator [Prevotella sp.]